MAVRRLSETPWQGRRGPALPRRLLYLSVLFVVLLSVLGGASAAMAAEYTVNSLGDQADEAPGSNGCKTAVATCTLRAAIEESNASIGVNDTIKFSGSFNGQLADTIELGSPLPTITDRVRIEGFPTPLQCETDYLSLPGPCVGVDGPAGGTAFRIAAERVVLIGFAISGAKTAVEAVGAPGLQTWNDWFGIKLDGSPGPIETGISVDQSSNGASIGGASSVAREIFAHNTGVGVDIAGADAVSVRGSGFGVLPDGSTPAANGTDIRIADAATGENRVASGNWIGGIVEGEQIASPICDGPCNVISGASEVGVDLAGNGPGEEPAGGSTRIFGNYIGLNAFGTSAIPNALQGVLIGSAENVTVGGPLPGDRNLINGGDTGILAGPNAGNLNIEGNWVGLDPSGTSMLSPPASAGIAIAGGYQVGVEENRVSMQSGTAIEQGAQEAVVRSNAIGEGVDGESLPGAAVGIRLFGNCHICNLLADNTVANAGEYGVLVENSRNSVSGNRIEDSGAAGVRIKDPGPFGLLANVIGGDSTAEENTISGSGGPAIEIILVTPFGVNTRNEVARNHGELNGGPFIELLGGANGEIPPPVIASATQSGASGTALPGATVRVFRKAGASPGELEGFLAEAIADEAGHWNVSYPAQVPGGTFIAATQTRLIKGTATPEPADGTSELAFSTTAAEPEEPKSEGGGGVIPQPPPSDTTPPQTILIKGPPSQSPARTAEFQFMSSERDSHFECKLDSGFRGPCSSPTTLRRLQPGKHVFKVWAIDASGNWDATPAKMTFRVLRKRPGAAKTPG